MINIYIENCIHMIGIKYAFEALLEILGLKYKFISSIEQISGDEDQILVYYGDGLKVNQIPSPYSTIYIRPSGKLFGEDYLKDGSVPEGIKKYQLEPPVNGITDVISIFNNGEELYVHKDKRRKAIETNLDFVSDTFFMLTRYEEVVRAEVVSGEAFDRFPAKEALAYKRNFLHRPVVNEYAELFWQWADSLVAGCRRRQTWGGKDFAACITHDVDFIQRYKSLYSIVRAAAGLLLRYKRPREIISAVKDYFKSAKDYTKDPFWTFDYLLGIGKCYGFSSSFYFMSGGTSSFDNHYSIKDERVIKLIETLEEHGCEVGYHGSFNSYNDHKLMQQEKQQLDVLTNCREYGCRQHFLRFRAPVTWRCQLETGLLYDTTLGYADCEGFRCGICTPFKPFDIIENKIMNFREVPLTVMEVTLQNENYRNMVPEEAMDSITRLIDTVRKHKGIFVLLWHNSSFEGTMRKWKPVYEKTLEYLHNSSCLILPVREAVKTWENMN